jgi:predicted MFS family arabinose efflux permease
MFYGWWVVLTAALALLLGPTPILAFSFGVFLQPLIHEFHSNRGAVSLAFTLHAAMVAVGLPFAGRLIDRFGPRRLILLSTVTVGLILISANLCSEKIWQLYIFYSAVGIASGGIAPVSYCHLVSQWFDRRRGLALGFMMSGLGVGAMIVPSSAHYLIALFGWRITFVFSGAAILLISLPIQAMILKAYPEHIGLCPDGDVDVVQRASSETRSGLSFYEACHTTTFWLMLCAFVLVTGSISGCFAHLAALLTDGGLPTRTAALATSVFGGGLLVGRVGTGYLLDGFFAPRVAGVVFGCVAAGMGLLLIAGSSWAAFIGAFAIGLGLGAEVDIMAYLVSRYFGLRSFGAIYGFLFAAFGLSTGSGAYLMGAAFDATGSYAPALTLLSFATVIGAALILRLGPYRFQKPLPVDRRSELQMLESES